MARPVIHYEVRDIVTDKVIATGSARECSAATGLHPDSVRRLSMGEYNSRKYTVRRVVDKREIYDCEKVPVPSLAASWDAFCEPIRRKYGIPVYKPDKEGK